LAEVIEKKFNIKPSYIHGGGGILEVSLDGNVIASNKKDGFTAPTPENIAGIVASALGVPDPS